MNINDLREIISDSLDWAKQDNEGVEEYGEISEEELDDNMRGFNVLSEDGKQFTVMISEE